MNTLLVDLDDTLIPNAYSYFQPQLNMAGIIIMDLGYQSPNPETIIRRATKLQVAEIARVGFIAKHNFPLSYVDVYKQLCEEVGRVPNTNVESAIFMAGIKYFLQNYLVYPGVLDTLYKLKTQTKYPLQMIIVTRGDNDVQQYKIDNTELGQYFEHIEIVAAKNKQTYLDIITKYNLQPENTIMVGDSLRNDIIPALEAGLYGVQVSAEDATDWEKSLGAISVSEDCKHRFSSIKNFTEIIDYLDKKFVPHTVGC
jgi:putative hydrolase of the HAD superfamily